MKKLTLITAIILTVGLFISLNLKSQNSNLANIDEFILNQMEQTNKPGLSACIIKGDSIVWSGNYGFAILEDSLPVSDTTLFTVCSVSKTISAACVLQLWDSDILDIDEDINNFLPFQIDNPYSENDSISARMLLTYTSSIKDNNTQSYLEIGDPTVSLEYFYENYLSPGGEYYDSSNFVNAQPGTFQCYSNIASGVWGYLIEPKMGMGMKEYARQYLFDSLEMERAAWFLSELNIENLAVGYVYSGGSYQPKPHYGFAAYPGTTLRSTVHELGHFLIMLMNEGLYNNRQVLSENTVDSMMTLQPPFYLNGLGISYTSVWNYHGTFKRNTWGKQGGSFTFAFAGALEYCPDDNTGIVFFSNSGTFPINIKKRLFDYAAMIVYADLANQISDSSFYANWQTAPDANGYFLDVALDEEFTNFVSGFQNYDAGADTNQQIAGLSSNTEYFYRVRAYNEYDTGAFSNTINLTTLLGTWMDNTQYEDTKIWSSGKTINIKITHNPEAVAKASIYSISGQFLGSLELKEGINSIKLNVKRQPIYIKVICKNKSSYKKVMVW